MAEIYYDSPRTGEELDAAFSKLATIDQSVQQAAQSASSAQGYASAASGSASQASTSAGQAAESAADASGQADAASESARQAAASAASIEGDVEAAANSASQAANSASQAATSASQAAESASDAADAAQTADDAKSTVQQSASAAQTAATQAAQSAQDAQSAATQASGSASTAQSAATLIEDNLEAIQAAPTNAQAAQTSAQAAEASAAAAEAAADRAEQIADFDPADFATAAQGALAESAVQSVNGKSGTAVALTPADIGAATAAQGAKADTAVQSINGAKPDSSGNVQLNLTTGTVRSVNGKDPDGSGNVQLSAGDVGAATAVQGAKADTALQPSALDPYALKSEIPTNPEAVGAATAAQGEKADSAVQPADLASYALKSEIPSKPSDIGAATAEQGERADTALQASDLSSYAKKADIPSSLPNPQSLTIQLNGYTQATYNGSQAKSVNITPSSIGAATSAQGALADSAIQSSDLTSYARKSDIPSELPNPQSLTIRLGQYGSSTTYDGNYSRSLTITPSAIGAGDMSKSTYDPQGKNQDVFAYCPHLYKATFRVNSWSGYTGNYSQNVYVTAVDGGPSITSSSVMVSGLFCDDTVQGDAQDELLEAAAIVDKGTKTFGSGTMTCSISGDKPTADAEVYFMARKGSY